MDLNRLETIISQFKNQRIAVIGDFFLDKYIFFDPSIAEVSLETGRCANQVVKVRCSPGAAGNVVSNLVALKAESVYIVGFTGDDGEGYELRRALQMPGCDQSNLLLNSHSFTPTYLKPQNISVSGLEGESERYDTKNRSRLPVDIEDELLRRIPGVVDAADAIIIVDQADEPECGVITSRIRECLCDLGARYKEKVFWTDSRHRAGLFSNVILKCNAKESLVAVGTPDGSQDMENLLVTGEKLNLQTNRPVFLTRGESGMLVFDRGKYSDIPAVTIEGPTDPTGAGDSATSGAVMALSSGSTLDEAAVIGNLTASVTVKQLGTTGTASAEQITEALKLWTDQN